jgi:protein-S-isoprenylcysteine O-methyltransferase Ste14
MKIHQTASIYFAFQGIAVIAWWLLLVFYPPSRIWFQLGDSPTVLMAFWLPDLFLLAIGSLTVGGFCWFESRFTQMGLWFVTGTITYATLYCLSFTLMTDTGWLGVVAMFPAMIWSGNFAIGLSSTTKELMFRRSVEAQTNWILLKTFTQIIVVWGLILFVFPYLITIVETKLGIPRFSFPFQKILAVILFPFVSLIGLSSAYTMAKIGRGTPLPMDTASKLVISGIYSYVRNPMAISGIGQGLLVGLFLGSPLVLLYALMGGFIWQMIFRPLEEIDLLKNFGADYEKYQRQVRCWLPRFSPYTN